MFARAGGVTRWHRSVGAFRINSPPPVTNVEVGDVYVHSNVQDRTLQTWVRETGGEWKVGSKGYQHPTIPDRCLSFRSELPSWVLKQSLATYQGRERREELRK